MLRPQYFLTDCQHLGQERLCLCRSPLAVVQALFFAGRFHYLRDEAFVTQELAERGEALCEEHGLRYWSALSTCLRGWAFAMQGQPQAGIQHIEDGLAAARATGQGLGLDQPLAMLAEAYAKSGRVDEGLATLRDALVNVETIGGRYGEAEIYRLKGELILQSHVQQREVRRTEAEGDFLTAITIARQQHAKSLELRAATSLARLWQSQGKRTEAHTLLSEVYHWFTEGFDTKDLQEAQALLEELARDV